MTAAEKLEAYRELAAYCREMYARTWGIESERWLEAAERWERKIKAAR